MGQRATATIRPVKVTRYDREMHCDVRTVVGFKVECACEWRSSTLPSVAAARGALLNHRATAHVVKPEAAPATSETAA